MMTPRPTPTVLPGHMLDALLGSLNDSTHYPPAPLWLGIPTTWALQIIRARELHFDHIEDQP